MHVHGGHCHNYAGTLHMVVSLYVGSIIVYMFYVECTVGHVCT